jgi:hypothetical protein
MSKIFENLENKLCDYGCGQIAKFQFKSGKICCESHFSKCSVEREKNRKRSLEKNIPVVNPNNLLCDYGCGQIAKFRGNNERYCCSVNPVKCPVEREKNRKRNIGKQHNLYKEIENFENKLCDYGCGQIAKHQTSNGKLCCSDHYSKCFIEKEKNKKRGIGKKIPRYISIENFENKLCDYGCGQIAKYQLKNGKICCSDNFTKCSLKKRKLTYKLTFKRYPELVKIENLIEGPNGEVLGHCKNSNCPNSIENGGRFILTSYQIQYRNQGINNINDSNYLYCCEECKKSCILFGRSSEKLENFLNPSDELSKASPQELSIWRSEVFSQQLKDNEDHQENFCEICHETETLVGHHILPQKLYPEFALDPDNGVILCSECHTKYGHTKGTDCSTGYLANKNCN